MRQKRCETDLQRNHKAKRIHAWSLEESENKSVTQERWRGKCRQLSPDMLIASVVQLFSTILYGRLYPRLDQEQAEDQAGFRSSYQTTDHLATHRMNEQKCHEWSIKMWIATIDFTKAFDSFSHKSIWKALKSCGIKHEYISLLKKFTTTRRHQCRPMWRATCSRSRKEPNRVTLCLACCSTQFSEVHWEKSPSAGKRKKECESSWATTTTTASQTCGSPTSCFCSQPPRISFKKYCTNSRKALKKWVSGSAQERRKFSATKAAFARKRKKKCKSTIL